MKRRRIVNALSIVSALLSVATAAMWVRSYLRLDYLRVGKGWGAYDNYSYSYVDSWTVSTPVGSIVLERNQSAPTTSDVEWLRQNPPHSIREHWVFESERLENRTYVDSRYGFAWFCEPLRPRTGYVGLNEPADSRVDGDRGWLVQVAIPFYALFITLSVLPMLRLLHYVRRPRPRAGFCSACGYDLRVTPERCPECGTVPAKK